MTTVRVSGDPCGFDTVIRVHKDGRRTVRITMESDCEHVAALAASLDRLGPVGIKELLSVGSEANTILQAAEETLAHAGCSVAIALIKAAEVELGLNVPHTVSITFENENKR